MSIAPNVNNDLDERFEENIVLKRNPLFKRVFSGWKSTIARLFLFALCASAIIALALSSQNKSFDQHPTERSVASRSLSVNAADVVSVDETVASTEPSTETAELAVDEAPIEVETESTSSALITDIQSYEQEGAVSDDVSDEARSPRRFPAKMKKLSFPTRLAI